MKVQSKFLKQIFLFQQWNYVAKYYILAYLIVTLSHIPILLCSSVDVNAAEILSCLPQSYFPLALAFILLDRWFGKLN